MSSTRPPTPSGGIAIVIVTYDAPPGLLEASVRSVVASADQIDLPVTLQIVDNGDGAPARLATVAGQFSITTATENNGFAAAVNRGFRDAIKRPVEYLVCLNDDVEVTPDWLHPLVETLRSDRNLGGVQPLLVDAASGLINGAGVEIDRYGAGTDRLRDQPIDRASFAPVTALTGGAMMIRATAFESIGDFDERFFLYYEDVEWCQRARSAGWTFAVQPDSIVYHHGSATTNRLGDEIAMLQERNRHWNNALHADTATIIASIWLTVRRLRMSPRRAHARALASGTAGIASRLLQRRRGD